MVPVSFKNFRVLAITLVSIPSDTEGGLLFLKKTDDPRTICPGGQLILGPCK